MRNPFRTEAEAFRFVWLTIIYFALIVVASVINTWLGLGVFIGETAILIWWLITRGLREEPVPQAPPAHEDGEHRILVIANETVGGEELLAAIKHRVEGVRAQVFVVCPALNSKLRHWVSDEDQARIAAQNRLDASLAAMHDGRDRGARPDRRRRPAARDRGRDPHLRPRRADHLDASRGPLQLARARHRRLDARALRVAR